MEKTPDTQNEKTVSPEKFYKKIQEKQDFTILDIRPEQVSEDWKLNFDGITTLNYSYSHLARNIPKSFQKQIGEDNQIIVVCTKGKSSKRVTENLRSEGYNAKSLNGGTTEWSKLYEKRRIPTDDESVIVYQYIRPSSGCLSYMIISQDEAIVIDPLKQYTETYIQGANDHKATIEYVVDTHIHADHISGFKDLSMSTNATRIMHKNSDKRGVKHNFRNVEGGEKIKFGSSSITAMDTPGHTTDMVSFQISQLLFTGDSLFLDSVARPDLEDPDESREMAKQLYRTIQTMAQLPDSTIVAPGHKSTQHPSDSLNQSFTDYLDIVRGNLDVLDLDRDEFVNYITNNMPPRPANYASIIPVNKGEEVATADEESQLELGPNNCSAG